MSLLRADGIESFAGTASELPDSKEPFGKGPFESARAIKKLPRVRNYDTMLYVGPFKSEDEAMQALNRFCPLLDQVGTMESSCEDMIAKREGNYFYTVGSFDMRGLRVLAK